MKEGEGPGFLNNDTHALIHHISELQKIDFEQMALHLQRKDIMDKIGEILDKKVINEK